MSVANNSTGGLTRRGFLKATGAAAGALGLAGAGSMVSADGWLAPVQAEAQPEERVAYTFHQAHCTQHCSMKCTVRDGRLCLIEPNDGWADPDYSTVCVRGLSEIQHIYSSDRIQTPLKRVGERGSGEFVSISWDEAMNIFSTTMLDLWEKYGQDCVVFRKTFETRVDFLPKLIGAQGGGNAGIDVGVGNGFDPAFGGDGYCYSASEARDWINAKTLIIAGSNYLESSPMQSKPFFEAKERGCEIITIDPAFSTTASKSNRWIPIRPGADGALFLGMITHIIDNDLFDASFMKANTSFPFLVSLEDGSLLRSKPVNPNSSKPETGEENPFMIWDEVTQSPRFYNEVDVDPALEGLFEIEGKQFATVFSLLKDNQKAYTVEWAAETSDVPSEDVRYLAEKYATQKPSSFCLGWGGNDKFSNADVSGHAVAILAAMTGNLGKPGAGAGAYVGSMGYASGKLGSWPIPDNYQQAKSPVPLYDCRRMENNVRALITFGDALMQRFANMKLTAQWAKELDFIVFAGPYHSTGADYADLILPLCSKFETDEAIGGIKSVAWHIQMQQKVLDPLFESRTDFRVEHDLLASLGMGLDSYLPKTPEELARYQLDSSKDEKVKGITIESLMDNQGIAATNGFGPIPVGFENQKYNTPSKRVEVYYEDLVQDNQQLPNWEEPCEVYPGNPLMEKYPLQLGQPRTRFRIHNQYTEASWIRQFYDVYLEMNPIDMDARGLQFDDHVIVFNDRGEAGCRVRPNNAIRPGTVRAYEGTWTKFMDFGNIQDLTNDTMIERGYNLMCGPVIPFNDTLVEVKKA